MGLKLSHVEFKALIDAATNTDSYPVYIPQTAKLPATAYALLGLERDIASNLKSVTVSRAVYSVHVVAHTFKEAHELAQKLIDNVDRKQPGNFLLVLVEDVADDYDPDRDLYIKTLSITARFKDAS